MKKAISRHFYAFTTSLETTLTEDLYISWCNLQSKSNSWMKSSPKVIQRNDCSPRNSWLFSESANLCQFSHVADKCLMVKVVFFLEELFSHPWLSLVPPRLHRFLHLVSRCPYKNFSALRPKKVGIWDRATINPPLCSPEVGELLKPFQAQQDFSMEMIGVVGKVMVVNE